MGQLVKNRAHDLFGDGNTGGYLYSNEIGDGLTDTIKLPSSGRGSSVGVVVLICGGNSGRIDVTFDTHEMIDAGTAVWIAWPKGVITGTDSDTFLLKVSGIRAVSVSGAITFKLSI